MSFQNDYDGWEKVYEALKPRDPNEAQAESKVAEF